MYNTINKTELVHLFVYRVYPKVLFINIFDTERNCNEVFSRREQKYSLSPCKRTFVTFFKINASDY